MRRLEEVLTFFKQISRIGLIVIGVLSAGATGVMPVSAQDARLCTSRDAMVKALKGKYQEQRRGMGVASRAGIMEFYVSDKGTWTIVMSMANGISCILAAGRDWEDLAVKPAGTNI